ncbi:MAG: glutathione-disulfide reductase [Pseudomonadales bacterium]|jgi:glutathione reductase (NADPH)|nr:glutathione-disulfide reductase [Pseudomonadales bacterium]
MREFDLFVIGAGSAGVRAARMAAAKGIKAAIAEERYLGGTCVNVGCIPKKLYHFAADYRYAFEDSLGFGWQLAPPHFDWPTLVRNKRQELTRLNGVYRRLLEQSGVQLYEGRAQLVDAHTVEVAGQRYRAERIVLASGGWPFVPAIPGAEHALSSNEIFDLPALPRRVLVVGGGYIAVELASIFAGLGSDTFVAHRSEHLLKDFDADLGQRLSQALGERLTLLLGMEVSALAKEANGCCRVSFKAREALEVDAVLFATGRKPNTAGLGLENTRVRLTAAGSVSVNEHLQTDEPSIYALGDVVGRLALTPVALTEAMYLVDHLYGEGRRALSYANVPTTIFSHPEVGTVGLSEAQARAECGEIAVYESEFRHLRHTLSGRQEKTYLKVVVDVQSDRVLGMHMLGADAGEIIQGFATAMICGLTKAQLDATVGIHPTVAEEFVTLRTRSR